MPHNTRTRRPPCNIYSLISTSTPNKTYTQENPPLATCRHRQTQVRYICTFTTSFTETFTINSSIHTMWDNIKSNLTELHEQHIPSKFTTTRFHQPWITTDIKRITRRKQRAYNRCTNKPITSREHRKYKELQKQTKYYNSANLPITHISTT